MYRLIRLSDWLIQLVLRVGYLGARLWWFARQPSVRGAALAIWHEGRLLVVSQSYRSGLDLPGGGRQNREPAALAACRETQEEVGLILLPSSLRFAGSSRFALGGRRITVDFFERTLDECPVLTIDNREIIETAWRTESELRDQSLSTGLLFYLETRRRG